MAIVKRNQRVKNDGKYFNYWNISKQSNIASNGFESHKFNASSDVPNFVDYYIIK